MCISTRVRQLMEHELCVIFVHKTIVGDLLLDLLFGQNLDDQWGQVKNYLTITTVVTLLLRVYVYFIRMEHTLNQFFPLFQETVVTTEFQANFSLDVMPFSSYSLTVKTRPKEGGFWSDPSTVHFRSQPAGLFACVPMCVFHTLSFVWAVI